jgi:branched-chain amino acid transport system substrate-binding protein
MLNPVVQRGTANPYRLAVLAAVCVAVTACGQSSQSSSTNTSLASDSSYSVGPGGFNFLPKNEAAACTGTQGNTASDVGITPTDITLGEVADFSSIGKVFATATNYAVQGVLTAVNQAGGICGRKLQLTTKDTGAVAARRASEISDLASNVFAFLGNDGQVDSSGVAAMQAAGVPDIGSAVSDQRSSSSLYWSAAPLNGVPVVNGHHYIYDTLQLGLKANGSAPKRLALVAFNNPTSIESAEDFGRAFQQIDGTTICYRLENLTSSTSAASYDAAVLAMEQNNCDGVFWATAVTQVSQLLQAMATEHFSPPFIMDEENGYDPALLNAAGSVAKGLQVFLWTAPLHESTPIIQLYKNQLVAVGGLQTSDIESIINWDDAQMLIYALIKAGRNPTRAGVEQILHNLTDWSIGDLASPYDPANYGNPAGKCIVVVQNTGDQNQGYAGYVRKWPQSGFYCDPAAKVLQVL